MTPLSHFPNQTLRLYGASSVPANFIPPSGGPFTFDNAGGGADVKHFNATTTFPANFAWTNPSTLTVINRSQGLTVDAWSGGAPGAYVWSINLGTSTSSPLGAPTLCQPASPAQAPPHQLERSLFRRRFSWRFPQGRERCRCWTLLRLNPSPRRAWIWDICSAHPNSTRTCNTTSSSRCSPMRRTFLKCRAGL